MVEALIERQLVTIDGSLQCKIRVHVGVATALFIFMQIYWFRSGCNWNTSVIG
jgi:hypothetical protein